MKIGSSPVARQSTIAIYATLAQDPDRTFHVGAVRCIRVRGLFAGTVEIFRDRLRLRRRVRAADRPSASQTVHGHGEYRHRAGGRLSFRQRRKSGLSGIAANLRDLRFERSNLRARGGPLPPPPVVSGGIHGIAETKDSRRYETARHTHSADRRYVARSAPGAGIRAIYRRTDDLAEPIA